MTPMQAFQIIRERGLVLQHALESLDEAQARYWESRAEADGARDFVLRDALKAAIEPLLRALDDWVDETERLRP